MNLFNFKQSAQQKDINLQLRQIRKQKYLKNMEQKKIFQHLIKNNLELDLKKQQQAKILANGIPQMYRQVVWPQLLKNNHGITIKLYQILLKKVVRISTQIMQVNINQQKQELYLIKSKSQGYVTSQQKSPNLQKICKWFQIIKQDIPRTFSQLKIFQSVLTDNSVNSEDKGQSQQSVSKQQGSMIGNDQSRVLFNMLTCWVMYRDDIGYRQGMSQIAAYLFIQLNNQVKAFQIFCTMITTDTLYQFFTMNLQYISSFCHRISVRLRERNEKLYDFFDYNQLDYKLFVLDWIFSFFTKCFQLDTIGKIWDLLLLNAMEEKIIVCVIVQIICAFEHQIYQFDDEDMDAMAVCRFLKKAKVDQIRQSKILLNLKSMKI